MPITTYTELQSAIANWLQRDDLAAMLPDFITLFEACANRRLRVRDMESVATLTPSAGDAALPADYLAWRRVTWVGARRVELAYVEPSWLQAAHPDSSTGTPKVFTIEGALLKIRPLDASPLELLYFQRIPALSATNAANWLLAAHPDLYLFGSLAEAQAYAVNADSAALWKARRDELIDEVERLANRSRGAGAIRVLAATP